MEDCNPAHGRISLAFLAAACAVVLAAGHAAGDDSLKIYLLAGQSNMVGHGYTHYEGGNYYNIPSLEFLLDTPGYLAQLPAATYTFKGSLAPGWMGQRTDAWGVHYKSADGTMQQVEPTPSTQSGAWSTSIMPLSPGFGGNNALSTFGPELSMGIRLAQNLASPVFLFKSATGGTTLAEDWRPPSAAAARGGTVGVHYTNTIARFTSFLNGLDDDLARDGRLVRYNNAPGYEVAGFVWFQGWNEKFNNGEGEYALNIVDLVHNVRASDPRIPDDLGVIIPESSDQHEGLNAKRISAVATLNAEHPGSAVFFENNDMIGNNWGYGFSSDWGYHFNAKAENYLEIGWRTAGTAMACGFTGSEPVPEPAAIALLALAAPAVARRRRR